MSEAAPVAKRLPRRDYILLPLISLLTAAVLSGASEFAARRIWAEDGRDTCFTGTRHKPDCSVALKNAEGPWITYRSNACGYRGVDYCGEKRPGTWRAVIVGTSIAYGLYVSQNDLFSTLAGPQLSRLLNRPVEFEDMGEMEPLWTRGDATFPEMAALKPDAVFLLIAPFDLARTDELGGAPAPLMARRAPHGAGLDWTRIRLLLRESRVLYMAQHFMLDDQEFFVKALATYADALDPSRSPIPPGGELRYERMDDRIEHFANAVHAAGARGYLIALPNRAQCALIGNHLSVPGMDPYIFTNRMRAAADRWGVEYIDTIPYIERQPKAEAFFYPVDGHPNAGAHRLMAQATIDYFKQRSPAQ